MCTDTETLQQITVIEEYLHEIHPRVKVERGKGSHELIIYEPRPEEGKDLYYEYIGLKDRLPEKFGCIQVEGNAGKLSVTI